MTNIVTHKTGTGEPHSSNHGLASAELAIKQVDNNYDNSSSGKLYYGENTADLDDLTGTDINVRAFGIGTKADSGTGQSGVPIGGNLYFKEGSNMTITQSVSGDVVELEFAASSSGSGDIEGVTAGNGLTGGGSSGSVTLTVGAGTGIDVGSTSISVDVSDFMTNGADNRVLTATGTDAMNAEANLTFDGTTLTATALTVDDISINGSTISDSGDMTIDLGGELDLELDSATIQFRPQISGLTGVTDATVISIIDDDDAGDVGHIGVGNNGALGIMSVDGSGTAAHMYFDADGDITLDAASGNIYVKDNGGNYTPGSDYEIATKKYVDDNAGGGGSTSPAGSDTEIQFNNSGSFGSSSNLAWDGTKVVIEVATDDTAGLKLKCTEDTANDGPRLDLERNAGANTAAADDEIGRIRFNGTKSNGSTLTYADVHGEIASPSNTSSDGRISFAIRRQGSIIDNFVNIGCSNTSGNRAVYPYSDDAVDLGLSSVGWKNIYGNTFLGYDSSTSSYLPGQSESPSVVYNMGSEQLFITTDGGIVTDLRAQSTSDEKLKENITVNTTGLSLINQLTPKNFTWKQTYADNNRMKENPERIGWIAQDVEKISSDYVEKIDYTEDGTEFLGLTNKFKNDLIAAQINAIKELSAKNDALEARIAALEAK